MKRFCKHVLSFLLVVSFSNILTPVSYAGAGVRIKDLARVKGIRENALVGYGIVVGLAGTGDSSRSKSTIQSITNTLVRFGVTVDQKDVLSKNVASVMVTANLPAFAEIGDNFDLHVSSMGDAKSLVGGTLLLTPLNAPNGKTYALAQGQLSVGGYKFDSLGNLVQKNHPTVGIISKGATVEKDTATDYFSNGEFSLILNEPDFTTADRVVSRLQQSFNNINVDAVNAGKIKIRPNNALNRNQLTRLLAKVENLTIAPDIKARVVVNERTGTVVSGGDAKVSAVSISHGNLKLNINTQYNVSQPSFLLRPSESISTQVVPQVDIQANEGKAQSVKLGDGTSVTELIDALQAVNLSTRDTITVLQAIKQAGALHAELVIQ
ncbi:MAG: flagellar basal body P-ring protein FlgI [Kangiellaceae bacterium]|nr:flagellar basal body P-ring protein FlgI [Kangiellaceae bacterium]